MSRIDRKSAEDTAKRERTKRVQVVVPADELAAIDEFRYQARMPSRSAAVRELLRRGLASLDDEADNWGSLVLAVIIFLGSNSQVLAIAEHEHLPEIAATALAQYLSRHEHGMEKIRDMIVDDIREAQQRQDKAHVLTLLHVLHHFLKSHPEVSPAQHPWSKLY
jgi:metal-responsive CopG/Arc/MetJ family transcriptional regulator